MTDGKRHGGSALQASAGKSPRTCRATHRTQGKRGRGASLASTGERHPQFTGRGVNSVALAAKIRQFRRMHRQYCEF